MCLDHKDYESPVFAEACTQFPIKLVRVICYLLDSRLDTIESTELDCGLEHISFNISVKSFLTIVATGFTRVLLSVYFLSFLLRDSVDLFQS